MSGFGDDFAQKGLEHRKATVREHCETGSIDAAGAMARTLPALLNPNDKRRTQPR